MSYQEKNKAFFTNRYVRTALLSAVYHIGFAVVAYFLYILIFANLMRPMLLDGLFDAIRIITGCMSAGLFLVAQCLIANAYNKNQQKRKFYLDLTAHGKSSDPVVKKSLLKISLLESLATIVPLAIFAFLNAAFYAAWGYQFGASVFFEDFGIGYVGIYQLLDNGWLGYFIMLVLGFSIALAGRIISQSRWESERL